MFESNAQTLDAKNTEYKSILSEPVIINSSVKLSEEEAIEFLSNWNLVTAYTLLDISEFSFTPANIGSKLNILTTEAVLVIETLKNMGLIAETSDTTRFVSVPLYFDDSFIASADLLSLYNKFTNISQFKITSKDVFSFRFDVMSRKVIQKYQSEIANLMNKIADESKGEKDCEVYASSFSFSKATRTRKEK